LRKSHALAEAEKLRLKGEIEALKGKAGQEKRELERVNAENETMRQKAKEADTIEARTGRLQEMLETSARAFQQLYYASVPRAEYERLQEEALSTRMSLRAMEDRASRFGMQVALAKEERQELRQRLKLSEDQRAMAEQIIEDLQEQRRASRDRSTVNPTFVDDNVSLDASPSRSQSLQLVDLALANSALHSSHLQRQLRGVSERHDDLLSSLSATSSTLSNTHGELSKIRSQHLHLQSLHTALEANHTPCAGLIINLQNDLTHCSTSQQGAQRSMEETKVELRRVEQKARTDREALKRANDGAMRWRSAETALEEEIATCVASSAQRPELT